jgi:hypothetical protein
MRNRPVRAMMSFLPIVLEKKFVNQFIEVLTGSFEVAPKILPDGLPNNEARYFIKF